MLRQDYNSLSGLMLRRCLETNPRARAAPARLTVSSHGVAEVVRLGTLPARPSLSVVMFRFCKRLLPTPLLRRFRGTVRWVTQANDPPHRLALGIALGLFCGLLPLVGLQTVLVLALAWLLGANKAIGLPLTWLTNPATFVPIFYPCYQLGAFLMGTTPVDLQWWQRLAEPPAGSAAMSFYWQSLQEVSAPLLLGSFLLATAVAVAGYYLSLQGIEGLRRAARRRRRGSSARMPVIG
ncbi:hypothetical protein UC8_09060 [Roseimaritima ulvae]|uniref:DUF2062 domain-containing protein n=1 Tax=Roseimaritima ulvae TaxID=980254 RepID=A0A5B9QPK3_9BACT|nr:hypothetical protein UC8_09060 [Roseimaritima ulvae]